jgi:prevent-host-death family protein
MERTWELQAPGAEVVEEALQNGPQVVTEQGAPVAVVLSHAEGSALQGPHANLARFFLESPLVGSGLDLRRDRRLS